MSAVWNCMRFLRWTSGAAAVALALVGCGGGGGSAVTPAPTVSAQVKPVAAFALAQQSLSASDTPAPAGPASANMVSNPGFENGTTDWGNWGNARVLPGQASSGTSALSVGADAGGAGQLVAGIVPGNTYRLTAQAKVSAASETLYVGVNFIDELGIPFTQNSVLVASTSYTTASVDVVAPPNAVNALVYVWKNAGSGIAYVDDFTFGSVGAASPQVAASANLVANGEFGAGLAAWQNWGNIRLSGDPSAPGVQVGTGAGGFGQHVGGIVPGTSYRVSALARVTTVDDAGYLGVMFEDDAGRGILAQNVVLRSTSPSVAQADVTAPPGATRALVFVWKNGRGGFAYVDELSLVQTTVAPPGSMDPSFLAGPVSVVNTTTANNQVLRAVGATQDGGYVVTWISAGQLLFMQAYDRAGARIGSEIRIPLQIDAPTQAASRSAIEQSSMVVLRDGSVVALYRVDRVAVFPDGSTSTTTGVFFQIFSANGMQLVPETEVESLPYAGPIGPSLAPLLPVALSDGGFAVASYISYYLTGYGSTASVDLRWFNRRGQPVGSPVGVGGFRGRLQAPVADAHGGLVFYAIRTDPPQTLQYMAFHYGPDHVLSQTIVGPQYREVLLLPLEDGYVLFTAEAGGGATMQMLDAQGNPVGEATTVASLPYAARELADGNYVVVWSADRLFTAQLFAHDGASLGKAVPISSNGTPPALATLAAPAFVGAWSAVGAGGDSDVYVQRFSE